MPDSIPEFYKESIDISELSALRSRARGDASVCLEVAALAWYMRHEKKTFLEDILELHASLATRPSLLPGGWSHRMTLIAAEIIRLNQAPDDSLELYETARRGFAQLSDYVGLGDVCLSLADLHLMCGRMAEANAQSQDALDFYRKAGDPRREALALARMAYQSQYGNASSALEHWAGIITDDFGADNPAAAMYAKGYQGGIAFQFGRFPQAIKALTEAFDLALTLHANWLAVQLANSIGAAYANLFDLPTAMEWKEKSYSIASSVGWPLALGISLASLAETTTSLKDFDRAQSYFDQATLYLERFHSSRRHVIFYNAHGNLLLQIGQEEKALGLFDRAQKVAGQLEQDDIRLSSRISKALALHRLARSDDARELALSTCHEAAEAKRPYLEIRALQALAEIQRADAGPCLEQSIATLQRAVSVGDRLDGFVIQSDLLSELARDYEAIGEYQTALHYERRARDSWQRNFDQQNGARILAMQVRFDTARAKADAEHHRELARSEAARAATLDEANQILERLGQVGQEITARLDYEGVFKTIYGHITELMPADFLSIGLVDEDRQIVDVRYRVEDGRRLDPRLVALSADSLVARCARENREILSCAQDGRPPAQVPGTRAMHTVLVRPLTIGDRVLGIISVQSDQADAYGTRERRIFRTLCAYSAIALSNAETYDQLERAVGDLREALHRLVQQEKMAALGQLVAGVAHEVNTPLGVTLSAISLLHDNIRALQESLGNGGLTRSNLTEHLQTGLELSSLAQRNVVRASDMIRSFKEVAVDRGSDDRRVFDLGDYLREIANLMKAKLTGSGSQISLDIDLIQMDTYPGALAQTITNLLANIADHAYGPDRAGPVRVKAREINGDKVEIIIADEGEGMAADVQAHVFDPFFTTNRAAGHMGLGLHVAYNQVTQRLGGSIHIQSQPGNGTTATIVIPRELPRFGRPRAVYPVEASVVTTVPIR
ncbi:GAF domain-containing protein [Azospirillum sp. RU38E]|nr:GAF domain-containing protein [Azospirillum sp. RU38E]SNS07661.1 GAF domain-containing protein [Azospirillum sp. RU37A]